MHLVPGDKGGNRTNRAPVLGPESKGDATKKEEKTIFSANQE